MSDRDDYVPDEAEVEVVARAMFGVDPMYGTDWSEAWPFSKAFFRDMAGVGLVALERFRRGAGGRRHD